jgi:MraZ protein
MFRGRYPHTIDAKGRLSVPAKFRDALAAGDGHLVLVPNEHSLEVHPVEQWEQMEARLQQQSRFNPTVRDFVRLYTSRAREVTLDGVGRILLPPDARQQAGLERDVMLVGGGLAHFEVWDRRRFEEFERSEGARLPTLLSELSKLGV